MLASLHLAPQMVVVLDCRGASSVGLTRHVGLLKKLAVTFNQHYPVREGIEQLLPRAVCWDAWQCGLPVLGSGVGS